MRHTGFAVALLTTLLAAPAAFAMPSILEDGVVDYARAHVGEQVGNGQCWTLAYEALDAAGAHLPGVDGYGPYQFGVVVDAADVQPGDVVQFEGARFVQPNGGWQEMGHHTAVIEASSGGQVFKVLNQNVNGDLRVQEGSFDLAQKTQGTVTFFRPQPR